LYGTLGRVRRLGSWIRKFCQNHIDDYASHMQNFTIAKMFHLTMINYITHTQKF